MFLKYKNLQSESC